MGVPQSWNRPAAAQLAGGDGVSVGVEGQCYAAQAAPCVEGPKHDGVFLQGRDDQIRLDQEFFGLIMKIRQVRL